MATTTSLTYCEYASDMDCFLSFHGILNIRLNRLHILLSLNHDSRRAGTSVRPSQKVCRASDRRLM